jgi:hypothetical protein
MAAHGVSCANCGTQAPAGAKFCGECGGTLAHAPGAEEPRAAAPTLFAIPSPIAQPVVPPVAQSVDQPSVEPVPLAVEAALADGANPTMVGVYAPSFGARDPEPAQGARQPEPERAGEVASTHRDEVASSAILRGDTGETSGESPGFSGHSSYSTASESRRRRPPRAPRGARAERARRKKLAWIAGAIAVGFMLMAGGIALTKWLLHRGEVVVSLEITSGVERLVVEVPEAIPGQRVRFDGELVPLDGGRATFDLEPTDVRVGANVVNVDLVSPTGKVTPHRLTLEVPYRIHTDAAGLAQDPPALRVRVEAVPGAIVLLDDHIIALDAQGRGHRDFPLDKESGAGSIERLIRHAFRSPSGEELHGTTTFVVPTAKLIVERPGTSIVTDEAAVELAVGVHPEARVTLDGKPVSNRGGRIVERLSLPSLGVTKFTLEAIEEGAAPSIRTIEVRRVANLALEVERFATDEKVDYAALAHDPNAYRGKRVKLDGLAYHVETKNGKSDLQILARDCPRGQKCPVWVSYPGVVSVRSHSWVRVAGEVSGEQRFRTVDTGRVVTVPRVDAAFVVQLSK